MEVDVETIFSILKVPNEKIRGKIIENVKGSVTSIRSRSGEVPDATFTADMLQDGLLKELGALGEADDLSEDEYRRALDIAEERYSNWEWTSRR